MSSLRYKIEELFGFDLRSLAALRIAVALLVIGDMISRSRDLVAHYTDFGAVPRNVIVLYDRWRISLHLMSGMWEVQALLFIITGFFALMLLAGYRTHLMTAILWFLLASVDSRNPYIADGGDALLRLTLFWGFFLPWGARFSMDRALSPVQDPLPDRVFSAATFAYAMQIVLIYGFSVMHKTSPEWRTEGTAVHYALHLIQMVNPIGAYLAPYTEVTRVLTHGIFWFQAIGPLLLFFPVWSGPIRTAAVSVFLLLHIGMGTSMQIGLFSWIAALAMLVFLPTWFWEKVSARLDTAKRAGTRIYYDEDCGFCVRCVRLLQTFVLAPQSRALPAQADDSIIADMRRFNSWVVVDETGKRHFGAEALRVVLERSPLLWFTAPLLRPPILRLGNSIYQRIADHRRSLYPFQPARPTAWPARLRLPLEVNALVLALLAYVLAWNLSTGPMAQFRMSERWRSIGHLLRLDQIWNPFSPSPPKVSEWYVIEGKLNDGRVVDLLRNGDHPSFAPTTRHFANYRWRKYFEIVGKPKNLDRLHDYARYACRNWNRRHTGREKVSDLEIFWLVMHTLPTGGEAKPEVFSLLKHSCDENGAKRNLPQPNKTTAGAL